MGSLPLPEKNSDGSISYRPSISHRATQRENGNHGRNGSEGVDVELETWRASQESNDHARRLKAATDLATEVSLEDDTESQSLSPHEAHSERSAESASRASSRPNSALSRPGSARSMSSRTTSGEWHPRLPIFGRPLSAKEVVDDLVAAADAHWRKTPVSKPKSGTGSWEAEPGSSFMWQRPLSSRTSSSDRSSSYAVPQPTSRGKVLPEEAHEAQGATRHPPLQPAPVPLRNIGRPPAPQLA